LYQKIKGLQLDNAIDIKRFEADTIFSTIQEKIPSNTSELNRTGSRNLQKRIERNERLKPKNCNCDFFK
jgi:hypothetical protein